MAYEEQLNTVYEGLLEVDILALGDIPSVVDGRARPSWMNQKINLGELMDDENMDESVEGLPAFVSSILQIPEPPPLGDTLPGSPAHGALWLPMTNESYWAQRSESHLPANPIEAPYVLDEDETESPRPSMLIDEDSRAYQGQDRASDSPLSSSWTMFSGSSTMANSSSDSIQTYGYNPAYEHPSLTPPPISCSPQTAALPERVTPNVTSPPAHAHPRGHVARSKVPRPDGPSKAVAGKARAAPNSVDDERSRKRARTDREDGYAFVEADQNGKEQAVESMEHEHGGNEQGSSTLSHQVDLPSRPAGQKTAATPGKTSVKSGDFSSRRNPSRPKGPLGPVAGEAKKASQQTTDNRERNRERARTLGGKVHDSAQLIDSVTGQENAAESDGDEDKPHKSLCRSVCWYPRQGPNGLEQCGMDFSNHEGVVRHFRTYHAQRELEDLDAHPAHVSDPKTWGYLCKELQGPKELEKLRAFFCDECEGTYARQEVLDSHVCKPLNDGIARPRSSLASRSRTGGKCRWIPVGVRGAVTEMRKDDHRTVAYLGPVTVGIQLEQREKLIVKRFRPGKPARK